MSWRPAQFRAVVVSLHRGNPPDFMDHRAPRRLQSFAVQTLSARALQLLGVINLLALLAFGAGCGSRAERGEVGGTAGVPGALPSNFPFNYRDASRGWPLWPLHRQHPIRASFLDPRGPYRAGGGGYHFGIDISVDDNRPEPQAPRGFSHEVYAVEGGEASDVLGAPRHHVCSARRVSVGHFDYWHVSPIVTPGQHVEAGAVIGWTCLGEWHMHLAEWASLGGQRIWVNPLHAGGKIAPYTDTAAPVVRRLRFFSPATGAWRPQSDLAAPDNSTPFIPTRLHGLVELRAEIGDPQSDWGFITRHPRWKTLFHPYRVAVVIRSQETRAVVLRRVSFESAQLPRTPYLVHYAPGTVENKTIPECLAAPSGTSCSGMYWFRPFSRFRQEFWDTRKVPNGVYDVTVSAWDLRGNRGSSTTTVVVSNAVLASQTEEQARDGGAAPQR